MSLKRLLPLLLLASPALAGPSTNMGWTEYPGTLICQVGVAACGDCRGSIGNITAPFGAGHEVCCDEGMRGIVAWSSAVYDTSRHRMVLTGGGHRSYCGNELYAFDLDTLTVSRLNDPCSPHPDAYDGTCSPIYCSNQPGSFHTYDSMEYVSHLDALWMGPGGSQDCGPPHANTYSFDFPSLTWSLKTPVTGDSVVRDETGSTSAYDASTGLIWFHDNWNLVTYTYGTNTYAMKSNNISTSGRISPGYQMEGFIDPIRRRYVLAGASAGGSLSNGTPLIVWYDLDEAGSNIAQHVVDLTGDGCTAVQGSYIGIDHDLVADKYVAWHGGNTVTTIDPDTFACNNITTYTGGPGALSPQSGGGSEGVHGRWKYAPEYGVFVAMNGVEKNFFTFRLTSDFEFRCAQPGVQRCYDFDSLSDLTSGGPNGVSRVNPPAGGTGLCTGGQCWALDTSVKANGASSLRFEIPATAGSDVSGFFRMNFSDTLQATGPAVRFGAGQTFYVHWRQRFNANMINQRFEDSGDGGCGAGGVSTTGFKQVQITQGDRSVGAHAFCSNGCIWSGSSWSSDCCVDTCTYNELVVTEHDRLSGGANFPITYQSCTCFAGMYDVFDGNSADGDFEYQNQLSACDYPTPSGCVNYQPDEWMSFKVRVDIGSASQGCNPPGAGDLNSCVGNNCYYTSRYRLWIGREGQAMQLVTDEPALPLYHENEFANHCVGGTNANGQCDADSDCPPDGAGCCVGGSNNGQPCSGAGDCPSGSCNANCDCFGPTPVDISPATWGNVNLLPYMTNKCSNGMCVANGGGYQACATPIYTWYDDLIISTQDIPDPGAPAEGTSGVCPNGVLETGEECDDNNSNNNDACVSGCNDAACGDGFEWNTVGGTEECDDGNGSNNDACVLSCQDAECGDGVIWNTAGGTEQCDDDNTANGDGCSSTCQIEGGGGGGTTGIRGGRLKGGRKK